MSFKPFTSAARTASYDESRKFPTPEAGNQPARVSLMVFLGTQEREDYIDQETKQAKPQSPCPQMAVYIDLVDNLVDYGGGIGQQQYRLALHGSFQGEIKGVNFNATAPRDAKGQIIPNRLSTFHTKNKFTSIARATGQTQILGQSEADNMDVSQLLGKALFADIEVVEKESNGKTYTNVKCKGLGSVPKIKGEPMPVSELNCTPMIISFDSVTLADGSSRPLTKDDTKFLRKDVVAALQKAPEYAGSPLAALLGAGSPPEASKTDVDAWPEADPGDATPY